MDNKKIVKYNITRTDGSTVECETTERYLKTSHNNRKLIWGVGINDSEYPISTYIDGKQVKDIYYNTWKDMLKRGYSPKFQEKYPTYIGTTICSEWYTFSSFKRWMMEQDWVGKQLDKDIKVVDNKVYSPDTCLFISQRVNTLLIDRGNARGQYLEGVTLKKDTKKYQANINDGTGKRKHLGLFNTQDEAHKAYCLAKAEVIHQVITELSNGTREDKIVGANLIKYRNKYIRKGE